MSLQTTLAANAALLLSKANVVGVGIGIKVKGGRKTDKPCITVLVAEKLPLQALAPADVVPKFIAGYPTDVITGAHFKPLPFSKVPKRRHPVRVSAITVLPLEPSEQWSMIKGIPLPSFCPTTMCWPTPATAEITGPISEILFSTQAPAMEAAYPILS